MSNRPTIVAASLMLAVALLMGAALWSMRNRASTDASASYAQPVAPPASGPGEAVTLYVADDDPGMLYPQRRTISLPEGRPQRAEEILRALLTIYLNKPSPHPLGPGSEVRNVYLVEPGLAVIDLNADFANGHRSGVLVEELTIASLVETLSANMAGIERVKFLVDGKERETLAGHADLSGSYEVSGITQMANALQGEQ
jgi:hypothetical protein